MPSRAIVARVKATFDFVGLLPAEGIADPQKAIEQRFKYLTTEIPGFVLEKKNLVITTNETELP